MVLRSFKVVILSALVFFIYIPGLPLIPPLVMPHSVTAVSFTLWGAILGPAGWGFTSSTITNPGPDMVVSPGASVTLSLFSADGNPSIFHRFCVDYETTPNFVCEANEPISAQFSSSTTATMFTFIATSTPGTYTYWCTIHGSSMQGKFVVSPVHDVAVTSISTSRNFAYSGVTANPIQVNVTAANVGGQSESFWVAAKANSTLIGNTTLALGAGQNQIVTFSWTTSSFARGNYTLTGQAQVVPGETNTSNNLVTGVNIFRMKFKGDVNGDCRVDIVDLSAVGAAFGSVFGSAAYKANADLNNDDQINIVDLVVVASSFGRLC